MLQRRMLVAIVLAVVSAFPAQAAKPKPLKDRIEPLLAAPDMARGFWGIEVVSLKSGKTLYAQNADKLFTPASNTKLFTTAAALAHLGSDYRIHTTVESDDAPDKYGRLTGDLVLVGRGDPNLSGRVLPYVKVNNRSGNPLRALEELADQVALRGVKFVDGDIVGDDTYFVFQRYSEGWEQEDLMWADGAPASALTINDNVLFAEIKPGEHAGDRAFLSFSPFADYYRVDNRVVTMPAGAGARQFFFHREPGGNVLKLWGSIPLEDPGATESLAIDDPALFAARVFRDLLARRGIAVLGETSARHAELSTLTTFHASAIASSKGGDTPPAATGPSPVVLATHQSLPLIEDVRVINKVSQNLHSELLLRLLGREKGSSGSIESGLDVLRRFLTQAGVPPEQYAFSDGSGLSRQNLVSPHAVVQLLQFAAQQPWGPQFRESLPVAGNDGSLLERFTSSPAQNRVAAKTGSLNHVKTLSGYATTDSGDEVAFSILTNNLNAQEKDVRDTLDKIVEAVLADGRPKKK